MTPTRRLPIFFVTGASCAGKSTVCEALFKNERDYIVMESDLLWDERFNTPHDNYREYRRLWLRISASISQSGKPVVLCGCCLPEQYEDLSERSLFSSTHYLAVVCDRDTLISRAVHGRGVTDKGRLDSSVHFNSWLMENAGKTNPPITLLDTTALTPSEAAFNADCWIRNTLSDLEIPPVPNLITK